MPCVKRSKPSAPSCRFTADCVEVTSKSPAIAPGFFIRHRTCRSAACWRRLWLCWQLVSACTGLFASKLCSYSRASWQRSLLAKAVALLAVGQRLYRPIRTCRSAACWRRRWLCWQLISACTGLFASKLCSYSRASWERSLLAVGQRLYRPIRQQAVLLQWCTPGGRSLLAKASQITTPGNPRE